MEIKHLADFGGPLVEIAVRILMLQMRNKALRTVVYGSTQSAGHAVPTRRALSVRRVYG